MTNKKLRWLLFAMAFGCFASIAFAYYYLEHTLYLNPCPLCMMQRVAFGLVGITFLLNAIFWGKCANFWRLLNLAAVFSGIALATRHLYIQSLPLDKVPKCGLDFYGVMSHNPFLAGIWQSMQGTGQCATKDYFFGLTIPTWSMMLFVTLLIVAETVAFYARKNKRLAK